MSWSGNNGGNNGGGRGPWGRPPSGGGNGGGDGGGIRPPDLDELVRKAQEKLKRYLPGGLGGSGAAVAGLAIVVLWLMSGIYQVSPDEQGVVVRFGKYVAQTTPGLNYHLPWPIETVYTPKVKRENQLNVGYQIGTDDAPNTEVPEESLMLTGDENIVDVNFNVFWIIKDASAFLFNVENPGSRQDATIKAVAESAMREIVGRNRIERILTEDREGVQVQVRNLMQKTLDTYNAGVTITRVQMQKVDPPAEVIDAYRDVQAARADQERLRNEAEAYANKIIPEARGQAARLLQEAEAYKQRVTVEATGDAKRFISVYDEYRKAPDVTKRRMYLETMTKVLKPMNKVITDSNTKSMVPYFQLPQPNRPDGGAQNRSAPRPPMEVVRPGAAQ